MKNYSVKEIADLLGTNPETVRRWIREKKLTASQDSRKTGNTVSEVELQKFLKANSKYAGIAAGSIAMSPLAGIGGATVALGGIVGSLIIEQVMKEKVITEAKLEPDEVLRLIQDEIKKKQASIKRKKLSIAEIEKEIADEEKQVESLRATQKAITGRIGKDSKKEAKQNE